MQRQSIPSPKDILDQVTVGLRRTAVRPSISGYKPQEHQIAFHQSETKGRAFIGGNRSGKTVGGGAEAVFWLTGRHPYFTKFPGPIRGRAIGVDFEQGIKKIILPEVARWIPPSMLKNGSWEDSYSKGDRLLTLTNGSTCEFMSYDQDVDKFAGTSRHFVWFDEEPPEDIFNENMARLIDTGGNWWLTMTPLIDMSWTYDRVYMEGKSGKNPNIAIFEVSTSENSYVNLSEMEILTMGLSDEEKNARLNGTYLHQTGTIYTKAMKKSTIIPDVFQSTTNSKGETVEATWPLYYDNWGHFGMLDHGYTNPTAFYLGAFDREGRIVIYWEYYETGRIVSENAQAILSKIRELKLDRGDRLQYIVADPSIRNTDPISRGSVHQAYGENGINLALGDNDVHAGILRVSGRFKGDKLFISERCTKLRWELGRYRWDKFTSSKVANRRNLKEQPLKKDDHAADAIRYGVMSRPALDGEIDSRVGNILNSARAVEPDNRIDMDLLQHFGRKYEDQLGSGGDWNMGDEY